MVSAFAQSFDPPQQVTDLKWMLGTWTGKGKMEMMGTAMDTSITMTTTMEGQFLKSVSVYDMGAVKMEETQYVGWNEEKKEYTSWAFTNLAPTPRIEHGKMENGAMVMTSESWQGMVGRGTMKKISETKVGFLLEFQNESKWDKAMDIELTKK